MVEGSDIVGERDQVEGLASSLTKPDSLLRHLSVGHSSVYHPDSILARRSFSLSLSFFMHSNRVYDEPQQLCTTKASEEGKQDRKSELRVWLNLGISP